MMNLGLVPSMEYFAGLPFQGEYIVYDLICLGILSVCMEKRKQMLLVKTPVENVWMVIKPELLESMIENKAYREERVKTQVKRFFYSTAQEIEMCCKMELGLKLKGRYSSAAELLLVSAVRDTEGGVLFVGATKENVCEAEEWFGKFWLKDKELSFSHCWIPVFYIIDTEEEC